MDFMRHVSDNVQYMSSSHDASPSRPLAFPDSPSVYLPCRPPDAFRSRILIWSDGEIL